MPLKGLFMLQSFLPSSPPGHHEVDTHLHISFQPWYIHCFPTGPCPATQSMEHKLKPGTTANLFTYYIKRKQSCREYSMILEVRTLVSLRHRARSKGHVKILLHTENALYFELEAASVLWILSSWKCVHFSVPILHAIRNI